MQRKEPDPERSGPAHAHWRGRAAGRMRLIEASALCGAVVFLGMHGFAVLHDPSRNAALLTMFLVSMGLIVAAFLLLSVPSRMITFPLGDLPCSRQDGS